MSYDPYVLPPNLPVPQDDGAADHLVGLELPDLALGSSQGEVNVRDFTVVYVYPQAGRPGRDLLPGWNETPGARGCTPQSCAFRDLYPELGVPVAGLSAQPLGELLLVADPELELGAALDLPTFEIAGRLLYRRLTFVSDNARIVKVFYPVFPPDENAADVLRYLQSR